jgi:hypothetical protein
VLTSLDRTRRWILILPAAVLCVTDVMAAEDLDFPLDPEATYSVTDRNQYACLRDGMIRAVYVEYAKIAGEPPCVVVYEKSAPEEASREIPWRAEADRGFCELHARELVEKLRDWGWKCGLFRDVLGINQ